jgi:hypothetical protein
MSICVILPTDSKVALKPPYVSDLSDMNDMYMNCSEDEKLIGLVTEFSPDNVVIRRLKLLLLPLKM